MKVNKSSPKRGILRWIKTNETNEILTLKAVGATGIHRYQKIKERILLNPFATANLYQGMTEQKLIDLVEYLSSKKKALEKWKKKIFIIRIRFDYIYVCTNLYGKRFASKGFKNIRAPGLLFWLSIPLVLTRMQHIHRMIWINQKLG